MKNHPLKNKISDMACIPKDVSLGMPYLSVMGNLEVYIENYRGILEYACEIIRIQTKIGRIHIYGKNLHIEYYSNDEMKIKGLICSIEFQLGGPIC